MKNDNIQQQIVEKRIYDKRLRKERAIFKNYVFIWSLLEHTDPLIVVHRHSYSAAMGS